MKREEALNLLKKLEATFDTIKFTRFVLLKNDARKGLWELQVEWLPQKDEKQKLTKLAIQDHLEIIYNDCQTIFRRST